MPSKLPMFSSDDASDNERKKALEQPRIPERPRSLSYLTLPVALCIFIFVLRVVPWTGWLLVGSRWPLGMWLPDQSHQYRDRALTILKNNPSIDGHNDLAIAVRLVYNNKIYSENFSHAFEHGGLPGHVDAPRIQAGHYGGAFWSAFWFCPADPFDFSDSAYEPIVRQTLAQLDLLHRLSSRYPKYFPRTLSVAAALTNFHKRHELISPLAIEGLHQVGNSFSNIRLYYELGVRYATLTWNCHNTYSDAAVITLGNVSKPSAPHWGGLSFKGRRMVREMNRLGMIVDLAHVSWDTMKDVLVGQHNPDFPINSSQSLSWTGSIAPPIVSHSSAYALCPHPRNVPDSILPLIKQRDSIVMVNFSPDFISCEYKDGMDPNSELPVTTQNATLNKVIDHIIHIGTKIGFDHVGIGSDFDGIETTPTGLEGVDKMPDLVEELLNRGVTEEDVIKVIGGNVLRVWKKVEEVSIMLKSEGMLPEEDDDLSWS